MEIESLFPLLLVQWSVRAIEKKEAYPQFQHQERRRTAKRPELNGGCGHGPRKCLQDQKNGYNAKKRKRKKGSFFHCLPSFQLDIFSNCMRRFIPGLSLRLLHPCRDQNLFFTVAKRRNPRQRKKENVIRRHGVGFGSNDRTFLFFFPTKTQNEERDLGGSSSNSSSSGHRRRQKTMRKQSHLSSSASRPATVESEEDEDEDEVILPLATSQPRSSKATSPLRPFIKKTRRSRSLCVGMAGDNVISLTPVLNAL